MVALRTVHLRQRRLLELTPEHFTGPEPVITFQSDSQRTTPNAAEVNRTTSVCEVGLGENPAAKARLGYSF